MQIVLVARIADVNQMIGHITVFLKILTRAEVHHAVDLSRVGRDNLSVEGAGCFDGTTGLAACRRSDYRYCLFCHECF